MREKVKGKPSLEDRIARKSDGYAIGDSSRSGAARRIHHDGADAEETNVKKKSKIIQIPMPEELLRELDELSQKRGESRSAVIREACAKYVTTVDKAERDRRDEESYRRMYASLKPGDKSEDELLGESQLAVLSETLEDEGW